jgi:small subunit ribosomal protein S1
LIDLAELRDAEGKLTVQPGEAIEATFVGMQNGALIFTLRGGATAAVGDRTLSEAFAGGLAVEGVVSAEINGGYEVKIAGQRAFCPYSQISIFKQEGAVYVGQKFPFRVTEYDPENHNIVVSRRAVLEQEREAQREALRAEIVPGQIREGTVSRLTEFGVFVDLGGLDGLVPLKEIAWARDVKPEDIVKPGDKVQVLVRETDWERDRVSLSLRAAQGDPWNDAVARYPVGSVFTGRVARLEKFGAFVTLVPGVDGLIPIGRLGGGRRIAHPREALNEGQEIEVRVESIDDARRRVSLKPVDARVKALKPGELAIGMEVEGIVEGIKEFGVFVRLSESRVGLLHIGETDVAQGGNPLAKLERAFPPAGIIKVVMKAIEGERVTLTLPAKWAAARDDGAADTANYMARQATAKKSFGSLADAFSNLKL